MSEDARVTLLEQCGDTTPRDRRNLMRFLWVLGAWAVCFVGASQLLERGLVPIGPLSWMVALLPTVVAIPVLIVYARYLREADELQRKIELEALALGFGGTFFALGGYRILERVGAPAVDLGDFGLVMAVLYTIGVLLGRRRYR